MMKDFDEAGWWKYAQRAPLHHARVGQVINPFSIAVHSTDMLDGHRSFESLLQRWMSLPGKGNGAHFLIGRTEAQGIYQMCSILRNANHAGGFDTIDGKRVYVGGSFRGADGSLTPANKCTVGIEVHNAGQLEIRNGAWRLIERDKLTKMRVPVGLAVPADQVVVDRVKPQRGYHLPTQWQMQTLHQLMTALDAVLPPIGGAKPVPKLGKVSTWADRQNPRVVFHATLDPSRKSDPWPLIGAAVNEWYP
jgi:N-acetyl-anhydromuramyl-L-alanine amidase AmpD